MTPAERVTRIEEECAGVWGASGVTSWEREFLTSVKQRAILSDKQERTLQDIERKVFPPDEDDES
jgi:hypothetical protein